MTKELTKEQKILRAKRLWKLMRISVLFFAVSFTVLTIGLLALDPPPMLWRPQEVTVVQVEHYESTRSRMRFSPSGGISRLPRRSTKLTDENGGIHYVEGWVDWFQVGQSYTLTYSYGLGTREVQGVSQGDTVYLDTEQSISFWKSQWPFGALLLLAMGALIWKFVRDVKRALLHLELMEYQDAADTGNL